MRTLPVDPVRVERSGGGSAAIAQVSPHHTKEAAQPKETLQKKTLSADDVQRDIEAINDQLESMNRSIRFSIDDSSKDVVVKVVNKDTGEVIKQFPPEQVLKLRERLNEMAGLLVEGQV
ncbi:MAG TPA: flagellar protein FlaG [Deltaproteobacteria bacterium]|nr:flagellar protein FlaG [Deltaproteobacteria bacterium]HOI08661.1 flagellar protein FlaG [Deltaproteobacteria bacterium]